MSIRCHMPCNSATTFHVVKFGGSLVVVCIDLIRNLGIGLKLGCN